VDLVQFFAMVRRRIAVIAICIAAGTGGGVYYSTQADPVYTATARVFLAVPGTTDLGQTIGGTVLATNQTVTYASVVRSRAVAARVISALQLNETPSDVADHLSAVGEKNTTILDISGTAKTPLAAQSLADAAARALGEEIAELQADSESKITSRVLDFAELPESPTSPNKPLDITVGVLLGIVAGLAAAALLEAVDRTVKTTSQADHLLGAPMLSAIPRRRGGMLVVRRDSDTTEAEPYRTLRTAVRFVAPDRPIRTLLVTSASPGDGKTTTAANLAVAIALSGERVVVVDADLRRARLASAFGLDSSVGLTSLVLGTATITTAAQTWDKDLKVLPSGPLPPNPSEIVGSQLFNQVLKSLADIADIVVIDAPPVLPVTDAVAIAAQVDGVLLVARYGKTLRSAASETRRKLAGVGANVVGYVLHAVPAREAHSYYAEYDYRRTSSKSRVRTPKQQVVEQ
jgi:capsular exopolysaccharide synthesis family protein